MKEDICVLCVNGYVSRLIYMERNSINIQLFSPKELLFLINENCTPRNIRVMRLAIKQLLGQAS